MRSSIRSSSRLVLLKVVVALSLVCGAVGATGVAPAFAEGEVPWWHVLATVAPRNLAPGGTGKIVLEASNLGDGEANGSSVPIVVSDKLPAGLVVTGISGRAGPLGFDGQGECSQESVSCVFRQGIPPYEQVVLELKVKV